MHPVLLPFLSPFLLGIGLYFVEDLWQSTTRRGILLCLITASSQWTIINCPYSIPIVNFVTGLGSAWYVVWSIDLLFVLDPRTFRRIQRSVIPDGAPCHHHYYWQPIPGRLTRQRASWVFDLVTNPRELGWQHGLHVQHTPLPTDELNSKPAPRPTGFPSSMYRPFIARHIIQLACAHLFMSMYEKPPFNVHDYFPTDIPVWIQLEIRENISLWAWVVYVYFLLTLTHSVIALVAVGGLGPSCLGTAGEPWMYPPIFGPAGSFFTTWEIQAFWGRWWHNVLRRSLLSVPRKLVPVDGSYPQIKRLLHAFLSFVIAGYFHAAACYAIRRESWSAAHIFFFFCLQPIPIAAQRSLRMLMGRCSRSQAAFLRGCIVLIGVHWVSWTFPPALWNPAIWDVHETFRVPWNIWSPLLSYLRQQR